MDNETNQNRITAFLFKMSSSFAVIAIGLPGVAITMINDHPLKWLVLILNALFISLSITYAFRRHSRIRRFIVPYLIIEATITTIVVLLVPNLTFYVIWFYVLVIEAMMSFSRRTGFMWLAGFILLTVVTLLAALPVVEALITIPIYLGGFYFFAMFANATYQANVAQQESQRLLEELQAAHRQLQEYAAQSEQLAVSEERNRLSREMHDTIGHRLTVAAVQLEGAHRLISKDPDKAETMVGTVREQVREALQELRRTVATLREPLEADLPLEISIKQLASSFENATGVTVNLLFPEDLPHLSASHRLALYRTAQETLTNVQKHAKAAQVWLQVTQHDDVITLRVSDNGIGLPEREASGGFGLRGIVERAAQLGGDLKLETRPGGGAQILLRLPL